MQNYMTVKDKAAEWNLSSRHVQYLCRKGEIEGAVKHAEIWFIPVGAPSPAKKTKFGSAGFNFVGTKKKIFYSAIELFMLNGFDSVSIRDIADKIGIRQSTIYNHFKSKQEILDVIYDFYCHYYLEDRPALEDLKIKLRDESFVDIIRAIRYDFNENYAQEMSDISKIIFQRIGVDNRANEIAKTLMVDEGVKYVETVFNMGIDSGRYASFDTHAMAIFINSVRIFTLCNWIIDPSSCNMVKLLEDEQALYDYAAGFMENLVSKRADISPALNG